MPPLWPSCHRLLLSTSSGASASLLLLTLRPLPQAGEAVLVCLVRGFAAASAMLIYLITPEVSADRPCCIIKGPRRQLCDVATCGRSLGIAALPVCHKVAQRSTSPRPPAAVPYLYSRLCFGPVLLAGALGRLLRTLPRQWPAQQGEQLSCLLRVPPCLAACCALLYCGTLFCTA